MYLINIRALKHVKLEHIKKTKNITAKTRKIFGKNVHTKKTAHFGPGFFEMLEKSANSDDKSLLMTDFFNISTQNQNVLQKNKKKLANILLEKNHPAKNVTKISSDLARMGKNLKIKNAKKMQAFQNHCNANIENRLIDNNVDLNFRKTIEAKKNGKKTNNNADLDALCNDTVATITDTFTQLKKSSQHIEFFPKALSSKTLMLIKKRRKLFYKTKNNADIIPLYNELKINTAKAIKNDVKLKYIKKSWY
ncbi:hypothetical protein BB561_003192 [Smittium simulii]|uniref:Uncharacterized protein n=1 Tax=Smittium simulii TaxID=133385 RepID=A0A2T9YMQ3_9FUNG|nr:hypothetical protein BB561_003192 [Smittium simulii]